MLDFFDIGVTLDLGQRSFPVRGIRPVRGIGPCSLSRAHVPSNPDRTCIIKVKKLFGLTWVQSAAVTYTTNAAKCMFWFRWWHSNFKDGVLNKIFK